MGQSYIILSVLDLAICHESAEEAAWDTVVVCCWSVGQDMTGKRRFGSEGLPCFCARIGACAGLV